MRLRNEPSVPPIGISDLFKPEQLASFLLGAVVVVFTGLVASRTGIIRTRSGNVKGLDIFAYKICMPIMLINIAATHNFTSYDWKFIAACMLAKLITFACVWAITYFFYKTDRPQRSRLTTAATTSTATVTSADLSFGIPLMRLICKSYEFNIDSDMLACTICSVLIFGPLSTALLHCSTATEEDNDDPRCQTFGRAILNHITLHEANLQVLSVLFGFAIRGYLSYASIDMDQRNQASTVSAIVNMFVVTFPVVALFVTGTMVDVAKNNQWTFFFATWKVFGAAFLSFSLRKAFGLGGDDNWSRASATFFYGSLPVSSAILTGLHVDRTSKELVAGIILWSYVISLPITLSGISLFGILEKSSHIIQYGMYSLDVLSCVLGLGICLVIILMGSQYGFGCRAKLLLFLYFLFTLASCFLYCITSVINDPSYCNVYFMYPHDRLVSPHFILLDMFSDTCTVMLVAFHVLLLRDSDDSVNEPCQAGLIAIVCFLVGGTKAWITFPACPAGTRMCGMALVSHTISPFARNTGLAFYGFLGCFGVVLKMCQWKGFGSARGVAFEEASDTKLARAWTTKIPVNVLTSLTDFNLFFIGTCLVKYVASALTLGSPIVLSVEVWVKWCSHAMLFFTMLALLLEKNFCSCVKARLASLRGEEHSTSESSDD